MGYGGGMEMTRVVQMMRTAAWAPGCAAVLAMVLVGCEGDEPAKNPEKAPGVNVPDRGGKIPPVEVPKVPTDELSKAIEAFTGGHTKLVWSAHQNKKSADTYASGKSHCLAGLDTRDGKGVRIILEEKSNYARPMVTPGGEGIVYTFNNIERKGGS